MSYIKKKKRLLKPPVVQYNYKFWCLEKEFKLGLTLWFDLCLNVQGLRYTYIEYSRSMEDRRRMAWDIRRTVELDTSKVTMSESKRRKQTWRMARVESQWAQCIQGMKILMEEYTTRVKSLAREESQRARCTQGRRSSAKVCLRWQKAALTRVRVELNLSKFGHQMGQS